MTWDELLESDPDDLSDEEIEGAGAIAFQAYLDKRITMDDLYTYQRVFNRLEAERVREQYEVRRLDEMFYDFIAEGYMGLTSVMAH